MRTKNYYVYIMANDRPTLYIGVTNDLVRRVSEHKSGLADGFTKQHKLTKLVYFETCEDPAQAIKREKDLKHWKREWKLRQIKQNNPHLADLYQSILG